MIHEVQRKLSFSAFLTAILVAIFPSRPVQQQWLRGKQYELRRELISVEGTYCNRLAWFSDDNRRVSAWYRSQEMAQVHFGEFDPVEELREIGEGWLER